MANPKYQDRIGTIYFSSPEQRKKYYDYAKSKSTSFSRLVQNLLEESYIRQSLPKEYNQDINKMREELTELHQKYQDLVRFSETQSLKLLQVQSEAFMRSSGRAEFSLPLLDILQKGAIHNHEIIDKLGINPKDSRTISGIARQLEMLELAGIITKSTNGWVWKLENKNDH